MDSLSSLDLLTTLEDDYQVVIPQSAAKDLQTFGQLAAYVAERQG
jgi:acyl carrier protein